MYVCMYVINNTRYYLKIKPSCRYLSTLYYLLCAIFDKQFNTISHVHNLHTDMFEVRSYGFTIDARENDLKSF